MRRGSILFIAGAMILAAAVAAGVIAYRQPETARVTQESAPLAQAPVMPPSAPEPAPVLADPPAEMPEAVTHAEPREEAPKVAPLADTVAEQEHAALAPAEKLALHVAPTQPREFPVEAPSEEGPTPALPVEEQASEAVAHEEPKAKNRMPTAEDEELRVQVKVGAGAKRVGLEQAGSQGGVKGSITPMNALSVEAGASLGPWHVRAGVERYSGDFATDRTDARLKEKKEFRSFSVRPGYGIFHVGLASKTAPTVRVSGPSLLWEEASALYALVGMRLEKEYLKRKPYWLGAELEAGRPVGVSGEGSTTLSSPGGFGLYLRGYAEKEILAGEVMSLRLGLEGSASYDKFQWTGSSGACSRTMQELGARLYLGMTF